MVAGLRIELSTSEVMSLECNPLHLPAMIRMCGDGAYGRSATCPRGLFGVTPNAPLWMVGSAHRRGCADVSIRCSRALPEYMANFNTAQFSHEYDLASNHF